MKKILLGAVIIFGFVLLSSCQTQGNQPVFTPGTAATTTPMTFSPVFSRNAVVFNGRIIAFDISPDLQTIAFATSAGVELYDMTTSAHIKTLLEGINVISLDWSADGKYLATSSIFAFTGKDQTTPDSNDSVVLSENGIEENYGEAHLDIWGTTTWEKETIPLENNDLKNERFLFLAWSPDSPYLAVTSDLHGVFVLDVTSGAIISQQGEFSSSVRQVSWSPDGSRLVATNDLAYGIRRWVVSSDNSVRLFDQRIGGSMVVSWSPDGQRIASGDSLGSVCLWTASTNQCDGFIHAHRSAVFSIAWSPDGNNLATGAGVVRIWDTSNGQLIKAFGEYDDLRYTQITWSTLEGPIITLQTGLEDESITLVRFWDLETGIILAEFDGGVDGQ